MTDYQNELVMEHLDLVNWVIRTRISVPNRPLLTYDDFYAIGCEAICRAALKYQADSGEFAPFACRYIYNAIIDHCRAMNYRLQRSVDAGFEEGEVLFDLLSHTTVDFEAEVTDDSAKVPEAGTEDMAQWHLFLEVQMGDVIKATDKVWINGKQSERTPAISGLVGISRTPSISAYQDPWG